MFKAIFAWEQFKDEYQKAANLNKQNNTTSYLVFVPSLKQFNATINPHQDDEIVATFGDGIYDIANVVLHDIVTSFAVWHEHNSGRL